MKPLTLSILCALTLTLAACHNKVIYSEAYTLPKAEWHADSLLTFNIPIADSCAYYDVLLYIRHTQQYPYQNMWLFVGNDTIEFYLADQRGQWLGNGFGELREMPVIYQQHIQFPHTGNYQYTLQQAMRDTLLHGVHDVGITVTLSDGKE